jgi:hypothetical protein
LFTGAVHLRYVEVSPFQSGNSTRFLTPFCRHTMPTVKVTLQLTVEKKYRARSSSSANSEDCDSSSPPESSDACVSSGSTTLTFGKHIGLSWSHVCENYPGYVNYLRGRLEKLIQANQIHARMLIEYFDACKTRRAFQENA